MLHRLLCLLAIATLTVAATPPPAALAPYIHEGRFDPGDYGWMRGAFAGASSAQRAEWLAIMRWRQQCREAQTAIAQDDFKHRGITPPPDAGGMGNGVCGSVGYAMPHSDQGDSWPAFQAAVLRARPLAETVIWSAALAQSTAEPDGPDEASLLIARPMTDQVLRLSLSWDKGEIVGAPALDPTARGIAEGLIWTAIGARDHANTAWLKTVVAAHGWPTIAKVGKTASHDAWLLVQHADDDPVFQFDMLRLMEPLAARGEVAKKDYAFLYDRVMLKIAGKQRYGTQAICRDGRWEIQTLEDAGTVDALRRQVGMGTSRENIARIEKASGPCPPDPVGKPASAK